MFWNPDWNTIKKKLKFQLQYSYLYVLWFLRWLVFGALTGIVCGLIGAAFRFGIDWVTAARQANDWLIFLLPFAGLLIVFTYHRAGLRQDPGTNLVLSSIQSKQHIPIRMAPLIFSEHSSPICAAVLPVERGRRCKSAAV